MLGKAHPKAFPLEDIISGFRSSWFYPMKRDVLKDFEFLSSYVSDKMPTTSGEALTREVSMLNVCPV